MNGPIQILDPGDLNAFLESHPFSVIHLDAEWDGCRLVLQTRIEQLVETATDTSFGYIDIDRHQDHARSIGLRNVPACSYYRGRDLIVTVIGMQQDIAGNLSILRSGGTPDSSNNISRK